MFPPVALEQEVKKPHKKKLKKEIPFKKNAKSRSKNLTISTNQLIDGKVYRKVESALAYIHPPANPVLYPISPSIAMTYTPKKLKKHNVTKVMTKSKYSTCARLFGFLPEKLILTSMQDQSEVPQQATTREQDKIEQNLSLYQQNESEHTTPITLNNSKNNNQFNQEKEAKMMLKNNSAHEQDETRLAYDVQQQLSVHRNDREGSAKSPAQVNTNGVQSTLSLKRQRIATESMFQMKQKQTQIQQKQVQQQHPVGTSIELDSEEYIISQDYNNNYDQNIISNRWSKHLPNMSLRSKNNLIIDNGGEDANGRTLDSVQGLRQEEEFANQVVIIDMSTNELSTKKDQQKSQLSKALQHQQQPAKGNKSKFEAYEQTVTMKNNSVFSSRMQGVAQQRRTNSSIESAGSNSKQNKEHDLASQKSRMSNGRQNRDQKVPSSQQRRHHRRSLEQFHDADDEQQSQEQFQSRKNDNLPQINNANTTTTATTASELKNSKGHSMLSIKAPKKNQQSLTIWGNWPTGASNQLQQHKNTNIHAGDKRKSLKNTSITTPGAVMLTRTRTKNIHSSKESVREPVADSRGMTEVRTPPLREVSKLQGLNKGNIRSKDNYNHNDELHGYSDIRNSGGRKKQQIINGKDFKKYQSQYGGVDAQEGTKQPLTKQSEAYQQVYNRNQTRSNNFGGHQQKQSMHRDQILTMAANQQQQKAMFQSGMYFNNNDAADQAKQINLTTKQNKRIKASTNLGKLHNHHYISNNINNNRGSNNMSSTLDSGGPTSLASQIRSSTHYQQQWQAEAAEADDEGDNVQIFNPSSAVDDTLQTILVMESGRPRAKKQSKLQNQEAMTPQQNDRRHGKQLLNSYNEAPTQEQDQKIGLVINKTNNKYTVAAKKTTPQREGVSGVQDSLRLRKGKIIHQQYPMKQNNSVVNSINLPKRSQSTLRKLEPPGGAGNPTSKLALPLSPRTRINVDLKQHKQLPSWQKESVQKEEIQFGNNVQNNKVNNDSQMKNLHKNYRNQTVSHQHARRQSLDRLQQTTKYNQVTQRKQQQQQIIKKAITTDVNGSAAEKQPSREVSAPSQINHQNITLNSTSDKPSFHSPTKKKPQVPKQNQTKQQQNATTSPLIHNKPNSYNNSAKENQIMATSNIKTPSKHQLQQIMIRENQLAFEGMVQESIDTFVESYNHRQNDSDNTNSLDIIDELQTKENIAPTTLDIYNQTIVQEDSFEEEDKSAVFQQQPQKQTSSHLEADQATKDHISKQTTRNKGWQTEEKPQQAQLHQPASIDQEMVIVDQQHQQHIYSSIVAISKINNNNSSIVVANSGQQQQYLTAQGKKQNTIYFSFRSQDKFIKRAANSKGWVLNAGHMSHIFTVKWEYSDSSKDVYKLLNSNQFYNHFPDSRELTTKQGLNTNLQNITLPGVDIYNFYPRCYDLSDQRQIDLFQDDFNRTAILCCIKKHAKYFKKQCGDIMKEIEARDNLILPNSFMDENKRNLKRSFVGKFPPKGSLAKINTILLRNAIFFARNLLLQSTQPCDGDEFIKKDYFEPTFKFQQRILDLVVKYSELEHPVNPEQPLDQKYQSSYEPGVDYQSKHINQKKLIRHAYGDLFNFRGWEIPNVYVMYQAYKIHKELKAKYHQYGQIDGADNVWICKPSFTARGVGIFCFKSLKELFQGQTKKQMQPKIVQKYVERSFLLDKKSVPHLNSSAETPTVDRMQESKTLTKQASPSKRLTNKLYNSRTATRDSSQVDMRKFDLRQWVYVNSFDPMSVFIYKKAYLRICGAHFDLSHFQDAQRHISNYSIQKDHELVLSSDDFIDYLKRLDPIKYAAISWENFFLPQIDHMVKSTLTQMAEVMESRLNSFELYGFDFVVDKDLKLWLIEVNMSPACAERQPWLISMLDDMSAGVVNMVQAKVEAYRESFGGDNVMSTLHNMPQQPGGSQAQDYSNRLKLYNKLQKRYLTKAIIDNEWQIMSKCDGFFLNRQDKFLKVKIPQSQTQINVNPGNLDKQNLELVGRAMNVKIERFLDSMCRRAAATRFIQKFFRGHMVRKAVIQQKQQLIKAQMQKKKATRVIFENLELAFDRNAQLEKREEPFSILRDAFYSTIALRIEQNEASLTKVITIQRVFRRLYQSDPTRTNQKSEENHESDNGADDDSVYIIGSPIKRHNHNIIVQQKQDLYNQVDDFGAFPSKTESDQAQFGEIFGLNMESKNKNNESRNVVNIPESAGSRGVRNATADRSSINFMEDDRIVQRSSICRSMVSSCQNNKYRRPAGNNNTAGNTEQQNEQSNTTSIVVNSHQVQKPTGQRPKSVNKRVMQIHYQLDSYLLLDYRAVGVELVVPTIELQRGKKLQSLSKDYPDMQNAQSSSRNLSRLNLRGDKQNYMFSPRYDCQHNGLVTAGYFNGKTIIDKSVTGKDDVIKRPNNTKKMKKQILQAYMRKQGIQD